MDEVAEKGFAAHWRYKGGSSKDSNLDEWIEKVKEFLSNPNTNALDFMNDFKHSLYENDLYVFTPKGQLKVLPAGATVLDFAFDIHTEVGCKTIGAKINTKLYPISHKLSNGDQIEIVTSKKQKPSEDWLNFTKTSKARTKIKSMLKEDKRKEAEDGKLILERKLRALKYTHSNELVNNLVDHFKQVDSLNFFFNIATKKFDLNQLKNLTIIGNKIQVLNEKKPIPIDPDYDLNKNINTNTDLLIFGGFADKVDYTIAKCCKPVAGDDVFGFITIMNGIKIHRTTCPNAKDLYERYSYRIVKTKWNASKDLAFLTGLLVTGIDDIGLVNKITKVISDKMKVNMRSISFDTKDGVFEGNIMVFVKDTNELKKLIQKLKSINGVHDVKRYS
ncbi:UNVERIFIED_CONTAM: hypothetical protein GTU68_024857 [Idotea baltica]|nr:hypothetical protein [Idotea baltica]